MKLSFLEMIHAITCMELFLEQFEGTPKMRQSLISLKAKYNEAIKTLEENDTKYRKMNA